MPSIYHRKQKFVSKHVSKTLKLKAILFINDVSTQSSALNIYFLLKKKHMKRDAGSLGGALGLLTARIMHWSWESESRGNEEGMERPSYEVMGENTCAGPSQE